METKFQTSFIPRKPIPLNPGSLAPMVQRRHTESTGIFFMIGVFVFVASVLSIGGAFLWKQILISGQAKAEADLAERRDKFDLNQISLMKAQATKITLANQLLNNHVSVSKVFDVVSKLTAESVRFTSMDLSAPSGAAAPIQLTLVGYGKDFQSVAFQSDVLNNLETYHLRSVVKNAIVTEPILNHDGTVSFGFTAQIDPTGFLYTKSLEAAAAQAVPTPGSDNPEESFVEDESAR